MSAHSDGRVAQAKFHTATILDALGYISGWQALYESVITASGMLANEACEAMTVRPSGAACRGARSRLTSRSATG